MEDLVFYFSNNQGENNINRTPPKPFKDERQRKFPRPSSLYISPESCASILSLSENGMASANVCKFCLRDSPSIKRSNEDISVKNCKSCTCFLLSFPSRLPPEVEVGNIEYKRKLVNPTPNRFEHLVTQMKWRLNEGGGEAIYRLGVDDDGHIAGLGPVELVSSLTTLERMATRLNATVHLLREKTIDQSAASNTCQSNLPGVSQSQIRKAMELLVRQAPSKNNGKPSICLAVLGGVDVGKSTLIGVLTDGELDNARGRARLNLFRHLHEVQSGRTSCLSSELLGFDSTGHVTNYTRHDGRLSRASVDELAHSSSQLITLLDSAGHSKYQRTTLAALTRAQPVGVLLVVSATTGLTAIGLEHVQLALALQLPTAVVISKIDQLVSQADRARQIAAVCRQVSARFNQLKASYTRYSSPTSAVPKDLLTNSMFFPVSTVTGEGLDKLLKFLSRVGQIGSPVSCPDSILTNPKDPICSSELASITNTDPDLEQKEELFMQTIEHLISNPANTSHSPFMCFWVSEVFTCVTGVPDPVVFGAVQSGQLHVGHMTWLGPDQSGEFHLVQIMSLHHNRQPHAVVYAGQTASVAIRFVVNGPYQPSPSQVHTFAGESLKEPCTEQVIFQVDNDENVPDGTDTSFSLPHDMLLPMGLRRGMVLLSNASWSGSYAKVIESSRSVPLKVPHIVSDNPTVGVAWTVEVELSHRLSIFPGVTGTPVVNPPLPLLKQRVTFYAGCVAQPTVVACESELSESVEQTPRLRLRFTRRPEYIDIDRQVILTWTSCAKAVGRVCGLFDLVPSRVSNDPDSCWINSRGRLEKISGTIELQLSATLPGDLTNPASSTIEESPESIQKQEVQNFIATERLATSITKCSPDPLASSSNEDSIDPDAGVKHAALISDLDLVSSLHLPSDSDQLPTTARRSLQWQRRRRKH